MSVGNKIKKVRLSFDGWDDNNGRDVVIYFSNIFFKILKMIT